MNSGHISEDFPLVVFNLTEEGRLKISCTSTRAQSKKKHKEKLTTLLTHVTTRETSRKFMMTLTPCQAFTEEEEVVFILKLGLTIRPISRVLSPGENTYFEFEDTYAKASGPRWS